jgi:sulfur-carrier protein adenylyltransferase/sulfurtransferase
MGKTYEDFFREALQVVRQVSVAEAFADHARGPAAALFLDVREPNEVALGAIPGALTVPRGRLEQDAPDWIFDPAGRVVCYCRAANAARSPRRPCSRWGSRAW